MKLKSLLIEYAAFFICMISPLCFSVFAQQSIVAYENDTTSFPNPERGWFIFSELKPNVVTNENNWATEELLDKYFKQGYRLAKHVTRIPTNTDPIPQEYLDKLEAETSLFRKKGMKIFYRFNYNWIHSFGNDDAPTYVTFNHLEQLKPFFERNKDVLAWLEMGFIGFWGEMHSSTQGHNRPKYQGLTESGKKILYKALDVFPKDRFVGVRYPEGYYRDDAVYGSLGHLRPITKDIAYNESYQARLAGWYANFGAGEKLWHEDDENVTDWAPSTMYAPMWAHCDHFETVSMDSYEWLEDAKMFHYVSLSNPKDEKHTYDIYKNWVRDGVYDDYGKYLGYRYRLLESKVSEEVERDTFMKLHLKLANDGWARATNEKNIEVIFRNVRSKKDYVSRVDLSEDFRLLFPTPGTKKKMVLSVKVPVALPKGKYELFLKISDPSPSISSRPEYCIRLANKGLWEENTGYNKLFHQITVKNR